MPSAASPSWAEWMEDTLRSYTGFPRPKTPDFRLFWSDEAAFKRTLRIGKPVVVTLVVPGEASCHAFEEELRKASAEFYKRVIFLQVNCADATDFCRSRVPTQLPWTEVFVPVVEDGQARGRVRIFKFDYHKSAYGLREFLTQNEIVPPPAAPGRATTAATPPATPAGEPSSAPSA